MPELSSSNHTFPDAIFEQFYANGCVWVENFLPPELNQALFNEVSHDIHLTPAGVGRETQHQLNNTIRRDQTRWFNNESTPQQAYLSLMAQLQQQFNRRFFLGLFDFECHYARYQQGDFYKKHLDAFKGRSNRVLTTVSYLNTVQAGGEIALYSEQEELISQFKPLAGSLLIFESERFPHEVLPAYDTRYSIAGWFRHNNSIAGHIDPPS